MTNTPPNALDAIVGTDPDLRILLARTARLAPTSMPVLVTGESGTGKELLARALHELGRHPRGPMVAVNCGALPRELVESELFGHERGAFTGAGTRRVGLFEEASGGTLVLDEVGELPLEMQPRLLRVLETGRIRRVGGTGETKVDVRIVALTLRDLAAEARDGRFRLDLFHRLAGVQIHLPPLRDRPSDIRILAQHFLAELDGEIGEHGIDPAALAALDAYAWPGNVRELRNVVRRAAHLSGGCIDVSALDLPMPSRLASHAFEGAPPYAGRPHTSSDPSQAPPAPAASPTSPTSPAPMADGVLNLRGLTFEEVRRRTFTFALRCHGSRRRAAASLGVSRSTFCELVKRWGGA